MIVVSNPAPPQPVILVVRIVTRDASGAERIWSSLAELREAYPGVQIE